MCMVSSTCVASRDDVGGGANQPEPEGPEISDLILSYRDWISIQAPRAVCGTAENNASLVQIFDPTPTSHATRYGILHLTGSPLSRMLEYFSS
jgi:hypothetical protein